MTPGGFTVVTSLDIQKTKFYSLRAYNGATPRGHHSMLCRQLSFRSCRKNTKNIYSKSSAKPKKTKEGDQLIVEARKSRIYENGSDRNY